MSILVAILAFNLIIIIHELGHFLAAKSLGIRVYEFSLFLGPRIFSFTYKGTIFSLRCIPIIAYVQFDSEDTVYDDKSILQYPVWKRAIVIAAGPLFNLLTAAIAFTILFSVEGYDTTIIKSVQPGTPAYEAKLQPGDRVVKLDGKSIVRNHEIDLFIDNSTKANPFILEVERDGKIIPVSFKPLVQPANRYILGFTPVVKDDTLTNEVDTLSKGSPAEQSGISKGDVIVGLDNTKVNSMIDIKKFMSQNKGKSVKVTVKRDGKVLTHDITPQQDKNSEFYESFLDFTHEQGNVFKASGQSLANTWSFSRLGIYSIGWMMQGRIPFTQMTGAVGAVDAINTVIEKSASAWQYVHNLLFVTALISIGLGVSNLLPIPPADGSRLILLFVEAVRRKPLPREKEAVVMLAGFVFMVAIFLFTFFNDIASWGKRI